MAPRKLKTTLKGSKRQVTTNYRNQNTLYGAT